MLRENGSTQGTEEKEGTKVFHVGRVMFIRFDVMTL
jgi:hypothetical protein